MAGVEEGGEIVVAAGREFLGELGLALELDGPGVGDVKAGPVEAHVGAEMPGEERMLIGGIAADKQDCGRGGNFAQAGGFAGMASEGSGEGRIVGGALVVDVVGGEHSTGELLQQVVFFVGVVVGANDADGRAAAAVADFFELGAGDAQGVFPGGGLQLAIGVADERGDEPVGLVDVVEAEAALGAEEIAVDAAFVAVVAANDFGAVVVLAHAEGDFAAIAAVGADGGDVIHLPGAGLVAIAAAGERAHGTDVDAHAALFAVEAVAPPSLPGTLGTMTE